MFLRGWTGLLDSAAAAGVVAGGLSLVSDVGGVSSVMVGVDQTLCRACGRGSSLDAFEVHRRLISDYRAFTEGFADIRDRRIREKVEEQSARGDQWPDPWLSLNPSFESGGRVDELVGEGLLHPACDRIFRVKASDDDPGADPITLHRHQREAIEVARSGASYVLTTGTGSGKSLAYIVPIVDRVLREGPRPGVKAIVVYPMNALANSQVEELSKFLERGFPGGPPVTFRRYTGQEKPEDRAAILADPPDILLTNYVMLELVLTRPDERKSLITAAKGLRFLVLDELHTYRGRQGADVAMLVRRVRDACEAERTLQCVGTSATMSSGGTVADQQRDVAAVATRIFGTMVEPAHVITESLVRATTAREPSVAALRRAVDARGDAEAADPALTAGFEALRADPLASWIEDEFGVREEEDSGRLIRQRPTTVQRAAESLASITGADPRECATALRATLLAGSRSRDPRTGRPLFAFRLHQFLSKGGSIYATAEHADLRAIETDYQVVLPAADGGPERRLYPLAFCRECGQEYLVVARGMEAGVLSFTARHTLRPASDQDGYLFISRDQEWPLDPIAENRLPESWIVAGPGGQRVRDARRKDVPQRVLIAVDGAAELETARPGAAPPPADNEPASRTVAAWIPGVFRFCLTCGVSYEALRMNEFAKLVTLDKEGRSSAMSVVAAAVVRALRAVPEKELDKRARKLLTFVDNRQDASLQAGHFNDFVQVVQLRAALHRALEAAGEDGLEPDDIASAVTRALALQPADFVSAEDPLDLRPAQRALRNVVEYRVLRDLQKGWRVTLPNLEQTGLLIVDYPTLPLLADAENRWADAHPRLAAAAPGVRVEIMRVLLDEFRRVLAIDAEALTEDNLNKLKNQSRDHLTQTWEVPPTEQPDGVGIAVLHAGREGGARTVLNLTARSAFGRWLRQPARFGTLLDTAEAGDVIESLIDLLEKAGVLAQVVEAGTRGYRLKRSALLLRRGDGTRGAADPIRRVFEAEQGPRVMPFFRDLYRQAATGLAGLVAAEHTAQVTPQDREDREKDFREGKLPLLFCSPTMELGGDIASLNAVGMRNVPPTPANYAQRSGRAGRSGHPALVVTYCSSGNAHDTYYFSRSHLMVAGQVQPPRLDLANEDLIRSHVHAVWLAEALAPTNEGLGRSLADVLDLALPGYPVRPGLRDVLASDDAARRARAVARALLTPLASELSAAAWWDEEWSDRVIDAAAGQFDRACERWRELYRQAEAERDAAYKVSKDSSLLPKERRDGDSRYAEARQRIELLLNDSQGPQSQGQSDFYTYRYLASEGFLPGYSFPRLPLAAYIPGSRGAGNTWLQRARFLAISEFGPGALIYHEGARYQVSRVSLPRSGDPGNPSGTPGDVALTSLRICEACGCHHPVQVGMDVCEQCGTRLGLQLSKLLPLQTVITRRRERISADEEERNRIGFELQTSYRFVPRGTSPGFLTSTVAADTPVATITYGDAAEVRVTNLGRRQRANKDVLGFYLDLVKGRWLPEPPRSGAAPTPPEPEDELEAGLEDVKKKDRVVPYVQDWRNIATFRWEDPVDEGESRAVATTLQYALERGIEATFQLEDSELSSELLPDPDGRGRLLLVEAAEGGAGVLRRLQAEPDAFARVATEALRIIHVDPVSGAEAEDACTRGCYRCLLTYGNQQQHEVIDRRLAVSHLRSLAAATTTPDTARRPSRSPAKAAPRPPSHAPASSRAEALLAYVSEHGLTPPDRVDAEVAGVHVDLLYEHVEVPTAILAPEATTAVPPGARDLAFHGYLVLTLPPDEDPAQFIAAHPDVFGGTS